MKKILCQAVGSVCICWYSCIIAHNITRASKAISPTSSTSSKHAQNEDPVPRPPPGPPPRRRGALTCGGRSRPGLPQLLRHEEVQRQRYQPQALCRDGDIRWGGALRVLQIGIDDAELLHHARGVSDRLPLRKRPGLRRRRCHFCSGGSLHRSGHLRSGHWQPRSVLIHRTGGRRVVRVLPLWHGPAGHLYHARGVCNGKAVHSRPRLRRR